MSKTKQETLADLLPSNANNDEIAAFREGLKKAKAYMQHSVNLEYTPKDEITPHDYARVKGIIKNELLKVHKKKRTE